MRYKTISSKSDLIGYLSGRKLVAFDIETAPDAPYRREDR